MIDFEKIQEDSEIFYEEPREEIISHLVGCVDSAEILSAEDRERVALILRESLAAIYRMGDEGVVVCPAFVHDFLSLKNLWLFMEGGTDIPEEYEVIARKLIGAFASYLSVPRSLIVSGDPECLPAPVYDEASSLLVFCRYAVDTFIHRKKLTKYLSSETITEEEPLFSEEESA